MLRKSLFGSTGLGHVGLVNLHPFYINFHFFPEIEWPNLTKLGRNAIWMDLNILCYDYSLEHGF